MVTDMNSADATADGFLNPPTLVYSRVGWQAPSDKVRLDDIPIELIDFSAALSLPRRIEVSKRLIYGDTAVGYYRRKPHVGAFMGTAQYAVLINDDAPFEMEWASSGTDKVERTVIASGGIQLHPYDELIYKRWWAPSRMMFIAVDRSFAGKILEDVFDRNAMALKLRIGICDPVIMGIVEAWRADVRQSGANGRVYSESLATALTVHLFKAYGDLPVRISMASGGMNARRLHHVTEYIEARFADDISLSDLASTAGLSTHHFNAVFKAEMGVAPHHYLIRRRIHHAKEMLLGGDMGIAQVAAAAGFSGQSHFTLNFRKLTGTTPQRFRLANKRGIVMAMLNTEKAVGQAKAGIDGT